MFTTNNMPSKAAGTSTLKFLPEKVEDVRERLDHLMKNFSISDRNEAVSLLDNLKRREVISLDMYKQYNDIISITIFTYI